jgi:hypothetical protein
MCYLGLKFQIHLVKEIFVIKDNDINGVIINVYCILCV